MNWWPAHVAGPRPPVAKPTRELQFISPKVHQRPHSAHKYAHGAAMDSSWTGWLAEVFAWPCRTGKSQPAQKHEPVVGHFVNSETDASSKLKRRACKFISVYVYRQGMFVFTCVMCDVRMRGAGGRCRSAGPLSRAIHFPSSIRSGLFVITCICMRMHISQLAYSVCLSYPSCVRAWARLGPSS
jgi:hypothetical protein